ncbi:MAG TPA: choice-of-anchor Q domain-containing protein [Kofleriaceae bacterium]
MLPGHYTEFLSFKQPTGLMVRVVAAGAFLDAASRLEVANGAKVRIEEIDSRAITTDPAVPPVSCFGPPTSSLTVERSHILTTGTVGTPHFYQCVVTFDRVDFEVDRGSLMQVGTSTFVGDRLHLHGGAFGWASGGTNQRVQITNSLFEGMTPALDASDTGASVSTFLFAFNTFIFKGDDMFGCPGTADSGNKVIRIENNIIVGLGTQSSIVYHPETCMPYMMNTMNRFEHNLLFPFTGASGTNIVMDPKFVNTATKDFHIQATSPARNAAVPSADLTTDHDYEGTMRTGTFDIGAFEAP